MRREKLNVAYLYLRIIQDINTVCQWTKTEFPVSTLSVPNLMQVSVFLFCLRVLFTQIHCFTPVTILTEVAVLLWNIYMPICDPVLTCDTPRGLRTAVLKLKGDTEAFHEIKWMVEIWVTKSALVAVRPKTAPVIARRWAAIHHSMLYTCPRSLWVI